MANKHTPGPWYFDTDERSICRGEENGRVRVCQIDDISREDNANARLIAAAPDLLEALRDMVSDHECLSEATLKFARTAIAKATGGAA